MVVLATKLYVEGEAEERALDALDALMDDAIGDLEANYGVEMRDDGFPSVVVTGEDAPAVRNLLREEYGEITPHFETGTRQVGTLEAWDEDGFVLDAGREVRIPSAELGLGQGSPEQIRTRFGLVQHMPLEFVYEGEHETADCGLGSLTDEQRDQLYAWTRGTGRVNVNSATRAEVRATVNRAGHAQDIVTVERLGLLEQSIVCAEGTDPPGLLAAIGEYLPAELLAVVP